jgi:thiol-disulfide isomerase/thioredoxin
MLLQSTFRSLALAAVLSSATGLADAAEWVDPAGRRFEGEVSAVHGSFVVISTGHQARLLPIARMTPSELESVAAFLAAQPQTPTRWVDSSSAVVKAVQKRLQVWNGEKLVDFDPGERPEPEVYLVYFSAHWCGPCRRFTPRLVEAYHAMKADPEMADRFELIFVSDDRDAREQLTYVKEAAMPWPVLKYSHLGKARVLERWSGKGIPCLVAVNRAGEVLFHSYNGDNYLGPDEPLKLTRDLLAQIPASLPATRLAQHPLVAAQHVYASRGTQVQPKPYVIALDPKVYQRSGITSLTVIVTVTPEGRITDASSVDEMSAVVADRLRQDTAQWLFLPAAQDGRAISARVSIPLKF